MKIGDKVRFLSEVGGGIVKGFQGKNIVLVEDEDGFDIPMLDRELVVIDTDDYNIEVPIPKEEKQTVKPKKNIIAKPEEVDDNTDIELPPLEVAGGDKLNVSLAYVPEDIKLINSTSFDAYLVNDSNYFLYFTYMSGENNSWHVRAQGLIEPNMKAWLENFMQSDLNEMENISVQLLAFKKDKPFELHPATDVRLRLDTTKFFKVHCFVDSDFFEKPALVKSVVKDDVPYRQYAVSSSEIEKEMILKRNNDMHQPARIIKKTDIKESDKIVIDLHLSELLDSTAGMSNSEMLNYQLGKFNETMTQYAGKHGQKLVFIHGKGEGVLRAAILNELQKKHKHDCQWQDASFKEYGYGATEVRIK
jgi:hypothetical protein